MRRWRRVTEEGLSVVVFYNPRLRRWQAMLYDPRTGRFVRELRGVRVRVTFSIETGKGHEPMVAEVTAETTLPPMPERRARYWLRRIVNLALELVYLTFDLVKDTVLFPEPQRSALRHRAKEIVAARLVAERRIGRLIREVRALGGFWRPREQYFVHQAVIKVGVEYGVPARVRLPYVRLVIEKKGVYSYAWVKTVRLARRAPIDMVRLFGIGLEREVRE